MADPRYFSFMQRPKQEFTFELTDDERITKARRILCGEEEHERQRAVRRFDAEASFTDLRRAPDDLGIGIE